MMLGYLGDGTAAGGSNTTALAPPTLGLTDGLKLWLTPSSALSAVQSTITDPSTSLGAKILPYTIGLLAPPIVLLMLLTGGGRR